MKTRLKMALLLHSGESGFAIVIAVSLGLIMVLVGLAMTLRSQGDQIVASTQKVTERSLAAAEKGVSYYQQFLNANRLLATYPDCANKVRNGVNESCGDPVNTTNTSQMSWSNANEANVKIPGLVAGCSSGTSTSTIQDTFASTNWKSVDSTDSTKGQFRLVSYKYTGTPGGLSSDPTVQILGRGILTIEGRITNPSASNAANKSISRLQVNIPVRKPNVNNIPVPGVWVGAAASEDPNGTGGNTIQGNVLLNNCDVDLTTINITGNYTKNKTEIQMPDVPARPLTGVINLGTISSSTAGTTSAGGRTILTLPRTTSPTIDATTTFQSAATYVYSVDSIDQNTTLNITPGNRVVIFLTGSINANNVTITHDCSTVAAGLTCQPINFRIYGEDTSGNGKICLNGGNYIDAFILAPKYMVGVQGGGSDGGVNGAVWANVWGNNGSSVSSTTDGGASCGSNTSNVVVRQSVVWDESSGLAPKYMKPTLDPITGWQRSNVN
ncbi:hypothetical protein A0J48_020300 [Sphaerospermopsis aphanizomenoides BCCUSP55]|uniref:hypothetical protein n=1 Tax=Sphaerospermopsis aphanizomenoides TaxID=459663 RepID=UPI001904D7DA|nr:hypothetical protein [Sphaerospermopsis aphanizomenoides]MBK1989841.1 hypothetical protein [Sphaerospermopsis aphanizomenoides BCCUSP55]